MRQDTESLGLPRPDAPVEAAERGVGARDDADVLAHLCDDMAMLSYRRFVLVALLVVVLPTVAIAQAPSSPDEGLAGTIGPSVRAISAKTIEVKVGCGNGTVACQGSVTIRSRRKVARIPGKKKETLRFGTTRFGPIAGGGRATVRISVPANARPWIARHRRTDVLVSFDNETAAGVRTKTNPSVLTRATSG